MVVVRELEQFIFRKDSAALGVIGTEIDMADVGLDDGAGAHIARFQRHVQVAVERCQAESFRQALEIQTISA